MFIKFKLSEPISLKKKSERHQKNVLKILFQSPVFVELVQFQYALGAKRIVGSVIEPIE